MYMLSCVEGSSIVDQEYFRVATGPVVAFTALERGLEVRDSTSRTSIAWRHAERIEANEVALHCNAVESQSAIRYPEDSVSQIIPWDV
jgi:hypothetical protein